MTHFGSRRSVFLDEIGVGPLWVRRDAGTQAESSQVDSSWMDTPQTAQPAVANANTEAAWDIATSARIEQPASLRPVSAALAGGDSDYAPVFAPDAMDWRQLKAAVSSCERCGLCNKRTNTVFGVGDEKAKWLFIGEGPGRNEDAQGEPFVGPAGKLLDNMLLSIGLKRGANAYIANIVKCRPTDANGKDRPPTSEEADACMPYLQRQIALIRPTVIIALGKTAALSLLKCDPTTPVSALRGTVHRYADLPMIVTYHPAYLLRSPADKRKTWVDLCLAMKAFGGADSSE